MTGTITDALFAIDEKIADLAGAVESGEFASEQVQRQIAQRGLAIQELAAAYHIGRPILVHGGVVYGRDAEVCVWVNNRLGGGLVPTAAVGFGILRAGAPTDPTQLDLQRDLIAGAYFFDHFDADTDGVSDITVSVASENIESGRKSAMQQILDYPFGQLKVRRITAYMDMSNERVIRNAQMLGFVQEGIKAHMGKGGVAVGVFGLYPETAIRLGFWTPQKDQAA